MSEVSLIKSMTGYGSASGVSGKLEISIEIKSVNNRYLDCSVKIPRVYYSLEETIKSLVQSRISRGKADVYVSIDSSSADDVKISINRPLAGAYITALKELASLYDLPCNADVIEIARFPEILHAEKQETDIEQLSADICAILGEALSSLNDMRLREGKKLYNDITSRIDEIERLTAIAEGLSPETVTEYRSKLETRMREILQTADLDESRILTEAALFADRIAINEETVRLRSHMTQLREMLESGEPVGRKMDFIIQEFNREVNTIGSKGNNAAMSKIVVDMKAEIEKIREQAQNVE